MDRRRFLKLAGLTAGETSAAVAVARALASVDGDADVSRPTNLKDAAGTAQVGDRGAWGRLVRLVDEAGRRITPIHSILMPSGVVLMIAHHNRTAFLLDPGDDARTKTLATMVVPTKQSNDGLLCAGHVALADGRLLVVGGSRKRGDDEKGLDYGLLLDPSEGTWARISPDMRGGARWYPTATRLPDSRILITGEYFDWGESVNRSIEIFDPVAYDAAQNAWTELISSEGNPWKIEANGEDYTHVFVLPRPIEVGGRRRQVLMVGRTGIVHFVNVTDDFTNSANRFTLRRNSSRPGGAKADGASSVLLPSGEIMIVGGSSRRKVQERADIYDPVRDQWRSISTGIAHYYPATVLLPDGTVFVVNGLQEDGAGARSPQIIDPQKEGVVTGPPWPDKRERGYHNTALLMPDGRILTAGGGRSDARFYSPSYLSKPELRPRITSLPKSIGFGRIRRIGYENGPVHRVTMIALGAMTHCFDQNQRLVVLFDGLSEHGAVTIRGPANAAIASPGDYMIFLLRRVEVAARTFEVPSVAGVVRLASDA
jgi:hypothetical protein